MAKSKPKFEEHLARLEKIVEELEGGDLTLDDSLARYEEGVKALKKCYEILRDAEKRVEILLKTAPFEPEEDNEKETADERG
jgi:exodeoxyribonuclease VII small subunit